MKSQDNQKTQEELNYEENASQNISKTDTYLRYLKKHYIIILIPLVLIGGYFAYKKYKK